MGNSHLSGSPSIYFYFLILLPCVVDQYNLLLPISSPWNIHIAIRFGPSMFAIYTGSKLDVYVNNLLAEHVVLNFTSIISGFMWIC